MIKFFKFLKSNNLLLSNYDNRKRLLSYLSRYEFLRIEALGQSLSPRDIDCVCIGNMQRPLLFCGAFHAMESITALVLIAFLFDVCGKAQCDRNFKNRLLKCGLVVIPCVNPDGVEIFLFGEKKACQYEDLVRSICKGDTMGWQANARGVDLNHNFDAKWDKLHEIEQKQGIVSANKTRYGGEFPESEPESKFLADLCRNNSFSSAFAFHTQGEEIYYDFNGYVPQGGYDIAKMMSKKSGYLLSKPNEEIASFGGFKDWFISYFDKPAFTIEAGKGKNPLPITDLEGIYFKLRDMLFSLLEWDY